MRVPHTGVSEDFPYGAVNYIYSSSVQKTKKGVKKERQLSKNTTTCNVYIIHKQKLNHNRFHDKAKPRPFSFENSGHIKSHDTTGNE